MVISIDATSAIDTAAAIDIEVLTVIDMEVAMVKGTPQDMSAVTPVGMARVNYIIIYETNSARVQGACYSRHIFNTALHWRVL